MKLLGISGTIIGEKTGKVLQNVLEQAKEQHGDVEVETLDLKEYNLAFCDGRAPSDYTGDTKKVIDKIIEADFYIIATPIFQASIPGVLKNLFDLLPVTAMKNKVVALMATSGTYHHYLVIENQLKPIISYFKAYIVPSFVYIHRDHFNEKNEIVDNYILDKVQRLIDEIMFCHRSLCTFS